MVPIKFNFIPLIYLILNSYFCAPSFALYCPGAMQVGGNLENIVVAGNALYFDVPVFGDIHGNLEGLFTTVQKLQQRNGVKYRWIIQVGDFGYYPDPSRCALVNGSSRVPDREMGVTNFINSRQMYDKYFKNAKGDGQLECKVVFVRGNHDDPQAIEKIARDKNPTLVSLDQKSQRLFYLPDGIVTALRLEKDLLGSEINIAGYGGIDPVQRGKSHRQVPGIGFHPTALNRLIAARADIDVLITHQGPGQISEGSLEIDRVIELTKPSLHLHGHSHLETGPNMVGRVASYGLDKMPDSTKPGDSGGFVGMLRFYPQGETRIKFFPRASNAP